uniref:Phosphohydrolase n=1 Tax=viral metagenome TaxID=1070528 RepID=A0A6M3JGC0_9ZZZZ
MLNEYDGHWITTYTGKKFHFLNPQPGEICIEDIAHALALTCRFGGHCREFYSVAEHSYRVAMIVDKKDKLAALLHDAHEAYLHDVPRPIKHDIIGYADIADRIQKVIHKSFSAIVYYPDHLKFADDVLLATEARDIMTTTQDWAELPMSLTLKIQPTNWRLAEKIFLDFYSDYSMI